MITCRSSNDASRALVVGQLKKRIEGASQLEASRGLKMFELEVNGHTAEFR